MNKKDEKLEKDLSMDELEDVVGGTVLTSGAKPPLAPLPSSSTSPTGPGTGISRDTDPI